MALISRHASSCALRAEPLPASSLALSAFLSPLDSSVFLSRSSGAGIRDALTGFYSVQVASAAVLTPEHIRAAIHWRSVGARALRI